ncbi:alanyl-tRNA editing protein [Actinocorallia lasiicapitis]
MTFPSGATTGTSTVLLTVPYPGGGFGTVVARTPFHPLDHTWPDQPSDTGFLTVDGRTLGVRDCVTGALRHGAAAGELVLGEAIEERRGDDGLYWLVVHVTDGEPPPPGTQVTLTVDADRRHALSAGHTGCHLAALALNAAMAARWRKEIRTDALGSPDFDQTAIISSRIHPFGSVDVYRLGKSLRKKGFTVEELAEELVALTAAVTERLASWARDDARVWVDSPRPDLTARRTRHCALPEGEVSIACGGTHLDSTGPLAPAAVTLTLGADGAELTMTTSVSG